MTIPTYWDRIAENYEDEIFSVKKHDRQGLVLNRMEKYSCSDEKESDLGCGIGNFLPALSSLFEHVIAIDISPKCIARAKSRFKDLSNISYRTVDLSKQRARLPKVDFALSVNSILMPPITQRDSMFDLICRLIQAGGILPWLYCLLSPGYLLIIDLLNGALKEGYLQQKQ